MADIFDELNPPQQDIFEQLNPATPPPSEFQDDIFERLNPSTQPTQIISPTETIKEKLPRGATGNIPISPELVDARIEPFFREIGLDIFTEGGIDRHIENLQGMSKDDIIKDMSDRSAVALAGIFLNLGAQAALEPLRFLRAKIGVTRPGRFIENLIGNIRQQTRMSGSEEKILRDIATNPDKFTTNDLAKLARKNPNIRSMLISQRNVGEDPPKFDILAQKSSNTRLPLTNQQVPIAGEV
jgi:hypothetical protein